MQNKAKIKHIIKYSLFAFLLLAVIAARSFSLTHEFSHLQIQESKDKSTICSLCIFAKIQNNFAFDFAKNYELVGFLVVFAFYLSIVFPDSKLIRIKKSRAPPIIL